MKEKLFTRNFTLLLLGQASSLLGNNTLKFALSMFVLEETGSATVFATILALAMAPTILLSPLGGILADRANRKSIMVALDSLSGLAVLLACLLLSLGDRVLVVGALLVALSILGAFESPTVQACVPQMLSGERLLQGNAAVSQIQAAASLVTPFLGSVLYTALGIQPIFLGAVACFFLTALLECFLQLDYRRPCRQAGVGAALRKDLSESMDFLIRQEPGICKLLLLAAPAGHHHTGPHLHALVKGRAVKQAVQKGDQRAVGRGVIDRACHHQSIRLPQLGGCLIDQVIKGALSRFAAGVAGDAPADILRPQGNLFHLNPLLLEHLLHLCQGQAGVAIPPGTAVDHQDLHLSHPFFFPLVYPSLRQKGREESCPRHWRSTLRHRAGFPLGGRGEGENLSHPCTEPRASQERRGAHSSKGPSSALAEFMHSPFSPGTGGIPR